MDKVTKKRIKRYLTWVCIAAVVAWLTVMPLIAKNEAEKDGPQASVLSAQVTSGSLDIVLHGGGTLESVDEAEVNIPAGVKITEFLVKNGDMVQEGAPLAVVDKTSVLSAIASVSDTMEYLRDALEEDRDEKVDEVITAVPGGRVKKVFAAEGETVQEVMLRDGALAVLSIDSLMAVKIEVPSALTTGDVVTVTLADGTEVAGRVESNLDGQVIVTVEDEGYAVGQTVTVAALGQGTLYVHNAWKATAYAGTVEKIHAKEEQTLTAGSKLFTLNDREFEAQMQYRANQHREYEQLLQRLLKMYESGTIDAPCEGMVAGVDADSAHLLAAESMEWEVNPLNNEGVPQYRIVFLSSTQCTGKADCTAAVHDRENHECINAREETKPCPAAKEHQDTCISLCTKASQQDGCGAKTHYRDCIRSCDHATAENTCGGGKNHYPDCIEKCVPMLGETCPATGAHRLNCIGSCKKADAEGDCPATGKHYSDCIHSCTGDETCPASKHRSGCFFYGMTFTAFPAKVFAVGNTELVTYASSQLYYVEKGAEGWVLKDGARVDETLMVNQMVLPTANASQFREGDVVLSITGQKAGSSEVWSQIVLYSRKAASLPGFDVSGMMGGFDLSGMIGGFSGFGNFGGMTGAEETEDLHDLEGSTLLTVTPRKTVKLTILLDEKDISKVSPGMAAEVKVEALRGQVFPAVITTVGISGSNSGGSSKFAVELELEAQPEMLSGMSASARILLETRTNLLTIPVAAVTEAGAKTLVCTTRNKDTGEPDGAVEVTTGISDGENVEILSGLTQGQTVYYSYYDTLELDTSAQAERFTFG